MSNYGPDALRNALLRHGIVLDKVDADLTALMRVSHGYDVVYVMKDFRLVDKGLLKVVSGLIRNGAHIIYGWHMPATIDHKVRLSHYLNDIINPLQGLLTLAKGFWNHVLNLKDYKILSEMGLKTIYMPLGTNLNS